MSFVLIISTLCARQSHQRGQRREHAQYPIKGYPKPEDPESEKYYRKHVEDPLSQHEVDADNYPIKGYPRPHTQIEREIVDDPLAQHEIHDNIPPIKGYPHPRTQKEREIVDDPLSQHEINSHNYPIKGEPYPEAGIDLDPLSQHKI